jgi:hypothetical protein
MLGLLEKCFESVAKIAEKILEGESKNDQRNKK